jgi:hypothetical protein
LTLSKEFCLGPLVIRFSSSKIRYQVPKLPKKGPGGENTKGFKPAEYQERSISGIQEESNLLIL